MFGGHVFQQTVWDKKNRLYNIPITKCINFGIIADQTGQNWFDCQLAWFELSIPLFLRFVSTQFRNVGRIRIISRDHPSRRIWQHVSLSEQNNIIVSYATNETIRLLVQGECNLIEYDWLIVNCLTFSDTYFMDGWRVMIEYIHYWLWIRLFINADNVLCFITDDRGHCSALNRHCSYLARNNI